MRGQVAPQQRKAVLRLHAHLRAAGSEALVRIEHALRLLEQNPDPMQTLRATVLQARRRGGALLLTSEVRIDLN